MENLSLDKFNPTKAELTDLSIKYKDLVIAGVDDEVGYKAVDEARKELKKTRVAIEKKGKELRSEALLFQKNVIAYEKDLVGIIEPVEQALIDKQSAIDLEKQKIELVKLLPERKTKLSEIGIDLPDDEILSMDIDAFANFYQGKRLEFLEAKEAELKKEEERIAKEKREAKIAEDAKKEAEAKAEKEKKEAQEKAEKEKKDAEAKAEQEKKDAIKKLEDEKQAIIDENNRKEKERIEKAEKEKKDEEERIKKEAKDKADLEAQEKYKKFLKDNNYNEDECYIEFKSDKIILYRKVAEFKKN